MLSMTDMWRTRAPPVPLDYTAIKAGTFELRGQSIANNTTSADTPDKGKGSSATENVLQNGSKGESATGTKLRDQKALSLQEILALFVDRCVWSFHITL
jgi:ubiquitin-like 1-activating enzyme E1 B